MKSVILMGCGALGSVFAEHFHRTLSPDYRLSGVYDLEAGQAEKVAARVSQECTVYPSLAAILEARPDYVVEFAGARAIIECAEALLCAGIHLVIASVGALSDASLRDRLAEAARQGGSRLHIISGAIGGFDLFRTLSLMLPNLHVTVDNWKAPESLAGAPWLEGYVMSRSSVDRVFSGNAVEAIQGFPKNVNVAVGAALASVGPERTLVNIYSVPGSTVNSHRIILECDGTHAEVLIESKPDPANPKSSTMTAWSALALLKNLAAPIQFF